MLVRFARLDADAAGGDLRVLCADGFGDVVGGEAKSDQPRRVNPYAQRAFSGVQRGAADAGNAPYLTQDIAHHEIAEPDFVEASIRRAQRDDLEHRAGSFLDQNALLHDRAREPRFDALDAILHLDRSVAGVGTGNEIGGDLDLAERVAG